MATTKNSKASATPEIRLPNKLPAIKGMTTAAVKARYRKEREAGLGHVRVMARLGRLARGETVPALTELRRFTQPVASNA